MTTVILEGRSWRYRVVGPGDAGPPLLLVHGAAGGLYVWQEQITGLGHSRRLIVPDLPGHGGSETLDPPFTLARVADRLVALADVLGVARLVPVGHSMGGAIALELALRHPDRVAALVLMSTGARLPVSEAVFRAIREHWDGFGGFLAAVAYASTTPPEIVARYTGGPLQATPEAVLADFEACHAFDARDRLAGVSVPTLVLWGEADALVGGGRVKQLAGGIPGSRLVSIPGAGHMAMQEQPARVNEALQQFLSAQITG
jgi:3-oxoadipate enol-lactonase / 4-carboxymuconolactone decarboxylase